MKINYGYFRHRFDASSDPKIQRLIDDMGICAVGYYFTLLELYGQYYGKLNDENNVEIHRRIVANTWRKRADSCDKVMTKLQLSELLVYTIIENTYHINIPKWLKYYGSYKKTDTQKVPKERKEKEIKEKEIKVKKTPVIFEVDERFTENKLVKDLLSEVKPEVLQGWVDAYEDVNFLINEFKKAKTWIIANPKKAPKQVGRFLTNWLNRSFESHRKTIPTNYPSKAQQIQSNISDAMDDNPYGK